MNYYVYKSDNGQTYREGDLFRIFVVSDDPFIRPSRHESYRIISINSSYIVYHDGVKIKTYVPSGTSKIVEEGK